jgi:hypothetical protein
VPELAMVMPWALVLNVLASGLPLSVALALGVPLPTLAILPVAATVLWCLIFATVAIRRFQREEF